MTVPKRTLALQLFESLCDKQLQASLISALGVEGGRLPGLGGRLGLLVHGGLGQPLNMEGKTKLFFIRSPAEENI